MQSGRAVDGGVAEIHAVTQKSLAPPRLGSTLSRRERQPLTLDAGHLCFNQQSRDEPACWFR